jgi:hypothetical protein
MREQWIGVEHGDTFTVAEDQDGALGVRIDNDVWAGEEDRWITCSGTGRDAERNVRLLAEALSKLADAMAGQRTSLKAGV